MKDAGHRESQERARRESVARLIRAIVKADRRAARALVTLGDNAAADRTLRHSARIANRGRA